MSVDLFTPVVDKNHLHPSFVALAHRGFEPARRMLRDIAASFTDKDGNFVKDFQSTGYDARLWELYLHEYLRSDGFELDESKSVPDFIAEKAGQTVSLEAVTVNPTQAKAAEEADTAGSGLTDWDLFSHRMQNVYPIKFGSPLFSKLKKKYWEKDYVRGKPFILAIEDFQDTASMVWTGSALELYLYGYNYGWYHQVDGELVVVPEQIGKHTHGAKEVPSGFFELPDVEHVSAVLFSNSATISKFNRMGFQKGYRPDGIALIRTGSCYNHTPNATEPIPFLYVVGSDHWPQESWAEGLSMFHNPNALVPVSEELFPNIAHHHLDDQHRMRSVIPLFHPYGSFTQVLNSEPDETEVPPVSQAYSRMLTGRPPVGGNDGHMNQSAGIRQISRFEFRSYRVAQGPVISPAMEKSWFAGNNLLGTVFLDVNDNDWNYVVLAPDSSDLYRWISGDGGMESQPKAEEALVEEMVRLENLRNL